MGALLGTAPQFPHQGTLAVALPHTHTHTHIRAQAHIQRTKLAEADLGRARARRGSPLGARRFRGARSRTVRAECCWGLGFWPHAAGIHTLGWWQRQTRLFFLSRSSCRLSWARPLRPPANAQKKGSVLSRPSLLTFTFSSLRLLFSLPTKSHQPTCASRSSSCWPYA